MTSQWRAWFALGVMRLGLRPSDFWALTVSEWRALVQALAPKDRDSLNRTALAALQSAFPDEQDNDV